MELQYTPYAFIMLLSALITLFLAKIVWKRREINGGFYFFLMLVAASIWSLTGALKLISADVTSQIFWSQLSYLGMCLVPPSLFIFALASTQNRNVKGEWALLFFLLPLLTIILAFTNEWHGLIWQQVMGVQSSGSAVVIYKNGIMAILNSAYSYALLIMSLILIGQNLFNSSLIYRRQASIMTLAILIPFISALIYAAGLSPLLFDPTPMVLAITGILIFISIFGYRMLDVTPPVYKTLFLNMEDGVLVLDPQKRIIDFNPTAKKILGIDESSIGEMVEDKLDMLNEILPGDESEGTKHLEIQRSSDQYLKAQLTPIYQKEKFSGWLYIFEDISDRKLAEKALKESENYYKAIFESTGAATMILEEDTIISLINTEVTEVTEFKRDEVENKMKITDIVKDEYKEQVMNYHRLRIKNPDSAPQNYNIQLITKTGRIKDVIATVSLIPANKKTVISFVDITKLKEAEEKIRKSLHEKEVLLQEIHHRVKNNMQIISSLLSLQASYTDNTEVIQILKSNQWRIRSMAMIHEKIYQSPDLASVNLGDYIENLVRDLVASYASKPDNIHIDISMDNILSNLETALPVGLIVNELVSNSLKYAFPDNKGNIKVELRSQGDKYVLVVADNGVGFSEGIDPFKQNSFGMKLVESLTEQLEGEFEVYDQEGVTFIIKFRELNYPERIPPHLN